MMTFHKWLLPLLLSKMLFVVQSPEPASGLGRSTCHGAKRPQRSADLGAAAAAVIGVVGHPHFIHRLHVIVKCSHEGIYPAPEIIATSHSGKSA